jgi:NAD(P)-dependent dehydrogenase (short-subunit alcohol dehydrogenase family)
MNLMEGKVVIVTGAAMGIGRASAILLAHQGANVVISDVNVEMAEETGSIIRETGGESIFVETDVANDNSVKALIKKTMEAYGKIDVLYNNVGVAIPGNVVETSEENWHRVLDINLGGIFRGCKYAIPHMIENGGGSIVNTSSVQALTGFEGWAGYAASKGAIISLTRQMAAEYAKHKIRVNCIAPGTIMTPMNEKIFDETDNPQELIDTWNKMHPIGRFGQPEEIAQIGLFLASEMSSFITGQCIVADGGVTIKAEK